MSYFSGEVEDAAVAKDNHDRIRRDGETVDLVFYKDFATLLLDINFKLTYR